MLLLYADENYWIWFVNKSKRCDFLVKCDQNLHKGYKRLWTIWLDWIIWLVLIFTEASSTLYPVTNIDKYLYQNYFHPLQWNRVANMRINVTLTRIERQVIIHYHIDTWQSTSWHDKSIHYEKSLITLERLANIHSGK